MESEVQLPGWINSINGSIAGSTSGLLTTPMDVLKTKRMTFQTEQHLSITGAISKILAEEGIKGLFRGASVRMMYLSVGGFAFFGMYEKSKQLIT